MKIYAASCFAFCITCLAAAGVTAAPQGGGHLGVRSLSYQAGSIERGDTDFPILAQLLYRDALKSIQNGDKDKAISILSRAVELYPEYPDAYFTMARLTAFDFNGEALLYLLYAFNAIRNSFHYQSLLLFNILLLAILVLVLVSSILTAALTIKYLPFSAHRLKEFFAGRFQANFPGFTAYLLLLVPFVLFPGLITGMAIMIIMLWLYLNRRERSYVIVLVIMFGILGMFSQKLKWISTAVNPSSLTFKIAQANDTYSSYSSIRSIEKTPAASSELQARKNLALGLLHLRAENFLSASDYLLKSISENPENASAFINLGNLYYLQGEYEKALEGYRKAEAIDSLNAVCQYNLAQAYIKTLLMAKSSKALENASALGIEKIKESYAQEALRHVQVYPALFDNTSLWNLALLESAGNNEDFIKDLLKPIMRFSPSHGALILLCVLILAYILSKAVHPSRLTFQCSNCGELTCSSCCNDDRGIILCRKCASTIDSVSSEKVIDALLRQCRQRKVMQRRKTARLLTIWLPGIKNIYYGRLFSGTFLALMCSISVVQLFGKGLLIKDWNTLDFPGSNWKLFLPAGTLLITYVAAVFSRQVYSHKNYAASLPKKYTNKNFHRNRGSKTAAS